MALFKNGMTELKKLEFNRPSNVLHHNKGETGYTYFGIYETAHPRWVGWHKVYKAITKYHNLKKASKELYSDDILTKKVYGFYKHKFWDSIKLDFVESQIIANELFVFGVNTNPRKAIKKAQKLIGVKVDGWIGVNTLKALNEYDENLFNIEFDLVEIAYYKYLAFFSKNHKRLRRFYDGWVNRARAV